MPSTSPMHAAYMRASERASQMPPAAGISAACTARRVEDVPGSVARTRRRAVSALPSIVSGPMNSSIDGPRRLVDLAAGAHAEAADERRDA